MTRSPEFRGNKQSLPSKPCAACGRTMTWRHRWARNWDAVLYCSDACRRRRSSRSVAANDPQSRAPDVDETADPGPRTVR